MKTTPYIVGASAALIVTLMTAGTVQQGTISGGSGGSGGGTNIYNINSNGIPNLNGSGTNTTLYYPVTTGLRETTAITNGGPLYQSGAIYMTAQQQISLSGTIGTGTDLQTVGQAGNVAQFVGNNPGGNVLNIENVSPSGYSTLYFYDNNGYEHSAMGIINTNGGLPLQGGTFHEVSNIEGGNYYVPWPDYDEVQTGPYPGIPWVGSPQHVRHCWDTNGFWCYFTFTNSESCPYPGDSNLLLRLDRSTPMITGYGMAGTNGVLYLGAGSNSISAFAISNNEAIAFNPPLNPYDVLRLNDQQTNTAQFTSSSNLVNIATNTLNTSLVGLIATSSNVVANLSEPLPPQALTNLNVGIANFNSNLVVAANGQSLTVQPTNGQVNLQAPLVAFNAIGSINTNNNLTVSNASGIYVVQLGSEIALMRGNANRVRLADFSGTSSYLSLDQNTAIIQMGASSDTFESRFAANQLYFSSSSTGTGGVGATLYDGTLITTNAGTTTYVTSNSVSSLTVSGNTGNFGTLLATNSFITTGTNATASMTSVGWTNNLGTTARIFDFTCTSAFLTNRTSGQAFSFGSITAPTYLEMQTNEAIVGGTCAAAAIWAK